MKKVSVIVPAYNSEEFIEKCLVSILAQTYKNLELIVCDDGSSDRTLDIVTNLSQKDNRIYVLHNKENMGISFSRNKCLDVSTGDLIALCDSDDWWDPNKLKLQINLMTLKNASLSHCNAFVVDEEANILGEKCMPKIVNRKNLIYRNFLINSSVVFSRDILGRVKYRNIKHEDYLFWLEVFCNDLFSVSTENSLVYYRLHSNNVTKNRVRSFFWHFGVWKNFGIKRWRIPLLALKNISSRFRLER